MPYRDMPVKRQESPMLAELEQIKWHDQCKAELKKIISFIINLVKEEYMKFTYSTITRTLTVFGTKMTHVFTNVSSGEIEALVIDAKLKEAIWRK
ncbi:hypothetical protein B9T27_08770 [Acinetobacter sp. ANC 4648]|nr:hypothetical protein B9T27_08770 [Acinetobacter sp. ANC 4648]